MQIIPTSWVDASVRSYSTVTGSQELPRDENRLRLHVVDSGERKSTPELRIPDGSFTASGAGGPRLTVIPQIETVIVNLMNTDDALPRFSSSQWDEVLAEVLAARR